MDVDCTASTLCNSEDPNIWLTQWLITLISKQEELVIPTNDFKNRVASEIISAWVSCHWLLSSHWLNTILKWKREEKRNLKIIKRKQVKHSTWFEEFPWGYRMSLSQHFNLYVLKVELSNVWCRGRGLKVEFSHSSITRTLPLSIV